MIAVLQRVREAAVLVGGDAVGSIGRGLLVFVGVRKGDEEEDARILSGRIASLRVFPDEQGKMNLSVCDEGAEVLVVSQFTLCADLRRGRRPGFEEAEEPARARNLIAELVEALSGHGLKVEEGRFGASMDVQLVNEGPATFLLDSRLWRHEPESTA